MIPFLFFSPGGVLPRICFRSANAKDMFFDQQHSIMARKHRKKDGELFLIPDHLSDDDIKAAGVPLSPRRERQAKLRASSITAAAPARP